MIYLGKAMMASLLYDLSWVSNNGFVSVCVLAKKYSVFRSIKSLLQSIKSMKKI